MRNERVFSVFIILWGTMKNYKSDPLRAKVHLDTKLCFPSMTSCQKRISLEEYEKEQEYMHY